MTGVATNVCVDCTARDGYQRDYYIVFLDDCTASFSLEDHKATLSNIDRFFGTVAASQQVVEAWP
jgi:ureidoacrylate peracid hydrolase